MLDLVFQNLTADKRYISNFFERILITCVKELKLSNKNMGVSVNLVGEARIRELNKKYRKKNKVTDVLSFPMRSIGSHRPEGVKRFEGPFDYAHAFDLGDIFICLSFAKKQAKSENVNIEKELAQLTVHGFLHLLGYDHERSEKDEVVMFKLEGQILNKLKIR